jgi:hypothetical protein
MDKPQVRKLAVATAALAFAAYGAYFCTAWLRYGRKRRPGRETDALLDSFMPEYEVAERHRIFVNAPAEATFAAASGLDFADSRIVRAVFKGRELLMCARPRPDALPRGLLAKTKALGWGVLAEVPGHEIVMGAVTQRCVADVVFRALPPEEFASFHDPGYVKIAWTLRADRLGERKSVFRTETRVLACGRSRVRSSGNIGHFCHLGSC